VTATCPTHDLSLPCQAHAADHLAGEHLPGSHHATCARCATPTDTPPAQIDAVSLAAADDSLDSPNEGDLR
jgi:hypothetical protein